MMNTSKIIKIAVVVFAICASVRADLHYYVTPTGNSLDDARTWVRANNNNMTQNLIVHIADGTYNRTSTLALDDQDSGTNGYKVIWQSDNGNAVISGGRSITGWTSVGGDIYKSGNLGSFDTRKLTVNGERRQRARGSINPTGFNYVSGYGFNIPSSGTYSSMGSWHNIGDIEIVDYSNWQFHRGPVASIVGNQLRMENSFWSNVKNTNYIMDTVRWVENAYELLDVGGEWYLDKSGSVDGSGQTKLYYKLKSGESISSLSIIAADLQTLLSVEGSSDTAHVENVEFRDIVFEYGGWNFPNGQYGFVSKQANIMYFGQTGTPSDEGGYDGIPGNVTVSHANNIIFDGCTFRHMGGVGLEYRLDVQNSSITNNTVHDISGSGIALGVAYQPSPYGNPAEAQKVKDNTIGHNTVYGVTQEYEAAVGIFVGRTKNTLVEYNTVYDVAYSGISAGWGWGGTSSGPEENTIIRGNKIYFVMQHQYDGGGIYVTSKNSAPGGGEIYDNYIYDFYNTDFRHAIYLDGNSHDYDVYNNVADNGHLFLRLQNIGSGTGEQSAEDNTVRDNWYRNLSNFQQNSPHSSNTLTNNMNVSGTWPAGAQDVIDNSGSSGSPPPPPPPPGNPIDNPGFETGTLANWTKAGTASVSSNNQNSGNHAAYVGTSSSDGSLTQTVTGLTANTSYTMTVWAKCASGKLFAKVQNFGGSSVQKSTTSTSYTQLTISFTTGSSNTSAQIVVWDSNSVSGSHGYFDDFSIQEDSPAPPSNPVNNPGFETGTLASWSKVGTASVSSNNQNSGSHAVHVGTSSTDGSISQVVTGLSPNTSYTLTVWAKCASGKLFTKIQNFGGSTVQKSTTSTAYTQLTLAFTTGSGNTSAEIVSWDSNSISGSHGYFDDYDIQ